MSKRTKRLNYMPNILKTYSSNVNRGNFSARGQSLCEKGCSKTNHQQQDQQNRKTEWKEIKETGVNYWRKTLSNAAKLEVVVSGGESRRCSKPNHQQQDEQNRKTEWKELEELKIKFTYKNWRKTMRNATELLVVGSLKWSGGCWSHLAGSSRSRMCATERWVGREAMAAPSLILVRRGARWRGRAVGEVRWWKWLLKRRVGCRWSAAAAIQSCSTRVSE